MKLINVSFILLITIASAADDDFCSQYLGRDLNHRDCIAAYNSIPETKQGDYQTVTKTIMNLFSNDDGTNPHYKLPQIFQSGQCAIEVAMVDGVDFAATLWDFQRAAAKRAISLCVEPHGIGGRISMAATIVTVRKRNAKSKPDPSGKCANAAGHSKLYQCLKEAEIASLAAHSALGRLTYHMDELTYKLQDKPRID
ncbi:hypothetical protein MMC16_004315 [Acarospora aff. strigata]|nr:hypothetical protein [Acarospora aff. strigata]